MHVVLKVNNNINTNVLLLFAVLYYVLPYFPIHAHAHMHTQPKTCNQLQKAEQALILSKEKLANQKSTGTSPESAQTIQQLKDDVCMMCDV